MKAFFKYFEEITGSLLLVGIVLITLFNVVCRYFFSSPLSWAEEIATYLFVWMAMIGAALALKTREHFMIEFLLDRIPGRTKAYARVVVAVLVVIASGVVFVNGLIYMSWGLDGVTPATEMSRAVPYGAVAAGGGLMLIRSFAHLVRECKQSKLGQREEGIS